MWRTTAAALIVLLLTSACGTTFPTELSPEQIQSDRQKYQQIRGGGGV